MDECACSGWTYAPSSAEAGHQQHEGITTWQWAHDGVASELGAMCCAGTSGESHIGAQLESGDLLVAACIDGLPPVCAVDVSMPAQSECGGHVDSPGGNADVAVAGGPSASTKIEAPDIAIAHEPEKYKKKLISNR